MASFDFADTAYTALDIAEYHAMARTQRSFIIVPDTHRHLGNSLVNDFVEYLRKRVLKLFHCRNVSTPPLRLIA